MSKSLRNLMIKAILLFPKRFYIDDKTIRHNRRMYVRAVQQLQQSAKWSHLYE